MKCADANTNGTFEDLFSRRECAAYFMYFKGVFKLNLEFSCMRNHDDSIENLTTVFPYYPNIKPPLTNDFAQSAPNTIFSKIQVIQSNVLLLAPC